MRIILLLVMGLAMVGCASNQPDDRWLQWAAAEQARQARLSAQAASCETDLCRVMVAQEGNKVSTPQPRNDYHPAWGLLDKTLSMALPIYGTYLVGEQWSDALVGVTGAVTSMDRSYIDNSLSVGGDQIGGDRVNDHSTYAGRDLISGRQVNDSSTNIGGDSVGGDQWHGDRYADSCLGASCANYSPGPVDNSDSSNNSDNSRK
ncbi:hypothetical protein [uncultured Gilvimarinus sp.]|uniref:hypothetical protein n=1 Tax=uncultured Gilvimarinus sp. TaxID=1689143 RepID=UPI0030EF9579|tara:strand:+ start:1863 stop:2474 length:612 start_codon:yes stop_codon:yes gene_type:complete